MTSAVAAVLLGLCFVASLGGLLNAAWRLQSAGRPGPLAAMQAALIGLGVIGIALHALPIWRKGDEDYPVIDATTLGFALLVAAGVLLPRIKILKIGDQQIELRETVEVASAELVSATDRIAERFAQWSASLASVLSAIAFCEDEERIWRLLWNFVRDRLGECRALISDSANSNPRLAVWTYDDTSSELVFYSSNEIRDQQTREFRFGPGVGMLGQAFEEQRTWNEPDARTLPSYVPIDAGAAYRAVLVTPISVATARLGMLSVDKLEAARFSDRAVHLTTALAQLLAIAFQAAYDRVDELDESGEEETH